MARRESLTLQGIMLQIWKLSDNSRNWRGNISLSLNFTQVTKNRSVLADSCIFPANPSLSKFTVWKKTLKEPPLAFPELVIIKSSYVTHDVTKSDIFLFACVNITERERYLGCQWLVSQKTARKTTTSSIPFFETRLRLKQLDSFYEYSGIYPY